MWKDVRFGARMLSKQPAFTWIAVVTLALGIGATSAVFSLIQGALLTPPPYRQPDRLMLFPASRTDGQPIIRPRGWPAARWMEWQKQSKSFEAIAAYSWTFNFLITRDGSESLEGMAVTKDYFRVAGLKPLMGRTFLDSDNGATAPTVAILGYEVWRTKFNGDPHILGKTMKISRRDVPVTIVGVMPPGIRFLPSLANSQEPNYNVNALVDFWAPFAPNPARLNDESSDVVGRLRDGVTVQQAQQELAAIARRQGEAERAFAGIVPTLESVADEMNRDGRRILFPLLGAAILVLLIACGNTAALLLVRGLQRQQEYAVRTALGVGRAGLFRQILTENLMLALLGGAAGVALALGAVRVFQTIGSRAVPRLDAVQTGWPVLLWGLGAAVAASVLAGLLPALRASRNDPMTVLKSAGPKSSAGRGESRLLRGVAMVQTALTLALLVGAGLLIRTMINLADVQSGFRTNRILTMSVTAVQGDWLDFHRKALERVSALPGVQYAAFAWGVPLTGNDWPAAVDIEGQPVAASAGERITLPLRSVTTDYFKLLGLRILDGRDFRITDWRDRPIVAVVNQALVARYFPNGAIGRKLWLRGRDRPPAEIVGVVSNSRTGDLTQAPEPEVYLSLWQASAFSKHLVVRTAGDPRSAIASVSRELHSVDPTAAVENIRTLDQIRDDSLASRIFAMRLLVGFAILGSVLTLVGIYGVLSLSVASRRRELAIRAAVGAGRGDLARLVFTEAFRLIAGGVISGVAAAVLLARAVKTFLYGVDPLDPYTLIGVGVLFAAVAMLACWIPTRRAARVDAVEALRCE